MHSTMLGTSRTETQSCLCLDPQQTRDNDGASAEKPMPFKPANAGCHPLGPYPAHAPAGMAAPPSPAAAETEAMAPKMHTKAWCLAASTHSGPTRSIVSMNV